MRHWVYDPHSGGKKIPTAVQERTRQRILEHAEKVYGGRYQRISVRFRSQFCYIDAFTEPSVPDVVPEVFQESREQYLERLRSTPFQLCRLRYSGDEERWTVAFYSYSKMAYEASVFDTGEMHGTPEEGFDVGAIYLQG